MRRLFAVMKLMLPVMAAAAIAASPVHALVNDPLTPSDRALLTLRGRVIDLQALERIERRRDFQQQQQYYRDLDRRTNQARPPRPEIPQVRQDCPLRVFGNNFISSRC